MLNIEGTNRNCCCADLLIVVRLKEMGLLELAIDLIFQPFLQLICLTCLFHIRTHYSICFLPRSGLSAAGPELVGAASPVGV